MRVLVLGAYGLIGLAIAKRLAAEGHEIIGLARSRDRGMRMLPEADWIGADMAKLTAPENWRPHLHKVDAVINAAGALQDGLRDNVARVQRDAVIALAAACEEAQVKRFVQISAPDASPDAPTAFYRTKGEADTAISNSALQWTILRPGLVIAQQAYGGTSLLRMLAAFPFVQPLVLQQVRIQTVYLDDVVEAVSAAVSGAHSRRTFDLVEAHSHTLRDILLAWRAWLGFRAPVAVIGAPYRLAQAMAWLADIAGWLGWRSSLRTTALKALEGGVAGDARPWREATGVHLRGLEQSLASIPATLQERIYARMALIFPLLLIVLSGFWIISGVIGLVQYDAAAQILERSLNAPAHIAIGGVLAGAGADIAIGAAILVRPLMKMACVFSIVVTLVYCLGAAIFAPDLWLDPLGPMVKTVPATGLALALIVMGEAR